MPDTIPIPLLPTVNAVLNGTCAVLLVSGYLAVRSRRIALHKAFMVAALVCSAAFLVCYLYYHAHAGSVRFQGQGWTRPLYFTVLISHTILAAAILPLVILTVARAIRGDFERHRRIARWTLPLWLYVSVTGVLVYLMLYPWTRSHIAG